MDQPTIYTPTEAATATAPDGRKLVFFTVPPLAELADQVREARPREYTYRWAYHASQQTHVLFFEWPAVGGAGIAIPEGAGDPVLNYMLGSTEVFITSEPVMNRLRGQVAAETVQEIIQGRTLYLPSVKFKPET